MKTRSKIEFLFALALFGTIGPMLKLIAADMETIVLYRTLMGFVIVMLCSYLRGEKCSQAMLKSNIKYILITSFGLAFNWILLFRAYKLTDISVAAVCNYFSPIITLCFAPLVFKEKLKKKNIVCIACAFIGLIIVSGVFKGKGSFVINEGVITAIVGAFGFSIVTISNKKTDDAFPPILKTALQLGITLVIVAIYVIPRKAINFYELDHRSIILICIIGIIQTGFAYILYFHGMKGLPITSISVLGYLEPVVAIVISVIFLKEKMTIVKVIGITMILCSSVANEIKLKNKE